MELNQASGMQRYVALFGYLHNDLGQAMPHAKSATQPGSGHTRVKSVSGHAGSRHACLRASMRTKVAFLFFTSIDAHVWFKELTVDR